MLLIINKSKKTASCVAETFYYMSILAYGATPIEALSEVSELYRAVLIINPEELPDINGYITKIKSYKSSLPIFAVTNNANTDYDTLFDMVFKKPTFSPALASKIITFSNEHGIAKIGDYRLAGIDSSSNKYGTTYFDYPISLTKTETMILRYLIRAYPLPCEATEILKYAFRPSRMPEIASIRTHISIINKKFSKFAKRKIISRIPQKGYHILTPEIIAKIKIL